MILDSDAHAPTLPKKIWHIIVGVTSKRHRMATLDELVKKQKAGAQFVISAQMLRLKPQEFDPMAQRWLDDGGPGFNVVGVPHRSVVDDEFLISRVTVIRTTAQG